MVQLGNSVQQMKETKQKKKKKKRCIFAAVGDVHGQFSKMIQTIHTWEHAYRGKKDKHDDYDYDDDNIVSFVLQVGDLEPHRHEHDLASMAMPSKHRTLGDFHKVVSGEISLPWPTYFIGGNHEPWEFLDQYEGKGFALLEQQEEHKQQQPKEVASAVPPNLYFLGRSSVTTIGPLRVAALSGIDGANSYHTSRPHVSQFPFTANKAYIHFTSTEVMGLVEEANNQHDASCKEHLERVRQVLSMELDMPSRAIASIMSSKGARVQCMDDLIHITNAELEAAGVKAGPREKIVAYQTQQLQQQQLLVSGRDIIDGRETQSLSLDSTPDILCANDGLVDVLMTHDWPSGISFEQVDERGRALGNEPCRLLLEELRPTLMLCGHMHTSHRVVIGPSTVVCLAKVPAFGSVVFFEVLDVDGDGGDDDEEISGTPTIGGMMRRRRMIRECR